jgi:hypothetical protein
MHVNETGHTQSTTTSIMKNTRLLLTLIGTMLLSCTGSPNKETTEPQEESGSSNGGGIAGTLNDLAKSLEEAAKAAEDLANKNVDPLDFRILSDLFPNEAAGLGQVDKSGEKSAISGMATSFAEARYENSDASQIITIKITDVGSMTSLVAFGMAWMNIVIDKESTAGYERTTKIDGHPALEKFTQGSGNSSGEITVVVSNRYIVEVKGTNVPMRNIKSTLGKINLSKLESMKNDGVTTTK